MDGQYRRSIGLPDLLTIVAPGSAWRLARRYLAKMQALEIRAVR
jgi:hypothetical protein